MGEFLSYSIKSGLLMLAMYLVYRLFLARENQHSFNRTVLLLIYFVSFILSPFIFSFNLGAIGQEPQSIAVEGATMAGAKVTTQGAPVWATVLIWLYTAGMIMIAVRTAITWLRLTDIVRSGERTKLNGFTLIITDNENIAPFSWMRYIVISRSDYENNSQAITTHELKHVASHHWIDLLIAQIVCIINWFNPAAWLMRDELMLIHEYQADMAVIDRGYNPHDYQMLLIKKAVGSRFPSLANSLNHSKLKKRITMMYKEKSGAGRKIKALALVPMLALAVGVTEVPSVRAAVTTISNSGVSLNKSSENPAQNKVQIQHFKVTNINNNGNETTVVIKGNGLGNNLTVSDGTFTTGGKAYHAKSLNCNLTDGDATITAIFPFSEEYRKPKMTLMINGQEIPFNLEHFFKNSQSVAAGDKPDARSSSPQVMVIKESSQPVNMDIYLDGVKITATEMNKLSSGNIASITVDRQKNAISITSK